jgi:hypothetical protein
VRVSLVCFGVDAQTAPSIHADLTGGVGLDSKLAKSLALNLARSE